MMTDTVPNKYMCLTWNTQPAVRRSEPSMSFAFNSSFLSVDGMTCLIPIKAEEMICRMVHHTYLSIDF
jgi:hypothetical protein